MNDAANLIAGELNPYRNVVTDGRGGIQPTKNAVDQALALRNDITAFVGVVSQLGNVMPDLSSLSEESKASMKKISGMLDNTTVMNVANTIQEMNSARNVLGGAAAINAAVSGSQNVTPLERTFEAIKDSVMSSLDPAEKRRYYDKKADKFTIPEGSKPGDGKMPAGLNLMIAYNLADRSKKRSPTLMNSLVPGRKPVHCQYRRSRP